MEDKDILEYENIGRKIKKSNKYSYIRGKQLTDPGTGTRVYDIDNSRLPSVTTILGATADKSFLKNQVDITVRDAKALYGFIPPEIKEVGKNVVSLVTGKPEMMEKK